MPTSTTPFHGRREAAFELGPAVVSETVHPPQALPRHGHARASLCWVERGQVFERSERERATFGAGALIARPAGSAHENVIGSDGALCLNVELDPALLRGGHDPRPTPAAVRLLGALRRELWTRGAVPLVAEGLALQLIGETCFRPDSPRRSAWLERVDALVAERFTEPLTVRGLAAIVGVHPVTLSRTYSEKRGRTLPEAIRARRLGLARQLLADPSLSLAEIAIRAGFADQSHFTRVFRDAFGLTPAAARAQARG